MNKEEFSGKTILVLGSCDEGKTILTRAIDTALASNDGMTIIVTDIDKALNSCPETTVPPLIMKENKYTFYSPPETRGDRRKNKRKK